MKMELIQPFINAADAVLAQGLQCSMSIGNLSMEAEAYRRKGIAALIWVTGDIEGRIILDLAPETAVRVASKFAGTELPETDASFKANYQRFSVLAALGTMFRGMEHRGMDAEVETLIIEHGHRIADHLIGKFENGFPH